MKVTHRFTFLKYLSKKVYLHVKKRITHKWRPGIALIVAMFADLI